MRNFIQYLRSFIKVIPKERGENLPSSQPTKTSQVTKEYLSYLMNGPTFEDQYKNGPLGMPIVRKSAGPVEITIHEKGIHMKVIGAMLSGDVVECAAPLGWINPSKIIEVSDE